MTTWRFDEARFVDEVLKPVQDGWRPDEDLFRVYLLPVEVTDRDTIGTAVAEVGKQFTKQQYRAFRRALEILRGQHAAVSETLLDPARRTAHRSRVEAARGKLATTLRSRLDGAPGLPPTEVDAQARTLKLPRSAVLAALRQCGGDEREPAELPRPAEPGRWADTRGHLAQLRHDSLWDYLAGLGGPTTTEHHLAQRRGKLRVSRSSDSAAETTLLRLIQGWLEQGSLGDVLRHEVLGYLADRAAYGYAEAVDAAEAAADRLRALGIGSDPLSVAYAVWCERRFSASAEPSWQENYQRAVHDLRLRAALAVLEQQPGLPGEWPRRRAELEQRLAELDSELERCRAAEQTDVEAAVAGYHRLRESLVDDRIDTALERCRPAAPPSATAVVRGSRVVVTWRPSSATAGRIAYRVSRDGTVLSESTTAGEVVDPDPPNGTPLVYQVHTLRDGNPSSHAAHTTPVTVLGDVLDAEAHGDADSVSGRWRLPDGAIGVLVTRSDGEVRDVYPTSFSDHDVRPGESYQYLVRARYRLPDGATALSAGVRLTATCQEVPVAVVDLVAEFDGEDLVARWTPPRRGDVELLELRAGEDPPEPRVVSAGRARRHGVPVRADLSGRGTLRGRASAPGKQRTFVPITVLGDLAAIGTPFELDARRRPVTALRLDRLGSTVRLTWEWPEGASAARVVWRRTVKPVGPTDPQASVRDVTRVDYDSRGVSVPVPAGDYWFGVCTSHSVDGVPSFGPLTLGREVATGTTHYSIRRAHLFSRRRVLSVEGDQPDLVVVAKSGVRPMSADDGEVLLRVEGGEAAHDGEFEVPRTLRRPVHLRAFSLDEHVVLVPSRPDDLIVRGT
ncbi:hypothetical protein IOD16_06840 [Saccharothrix sp. 6-C]|uniref:hypothetical protein n=1 Tax=Saccharothrix sp. 6-C TaxID=2781735 RepID=UPI001916FB6B|nr:hypothetical protein [Saccharothrix sp. 6-C]QQQ78182.1 hypothetical protein IOD16_06840 [Saccharothrix sp. 6-C]